MNRLPRPTLVLAILALFAAATQASAQLSLQWMVPAAANTAGLNGTFWRTDLSLHNPHSFDLPVEIDFLPSDSDNNVADALFVTLGPWETVNLWDVLGPEYFATGGTGAVLVVADWSLACEPVEDCEFLATSRTYTVDPRTGIGEFGQTIPGSSTWQGIDWTTLGYAAGILNDGVSFRSNIGIASWTDDWISVVVDVQDADGVIVDSRGYEVPPFGHLQRRLTSPIEGGSVVFWLEDGPVDPLFFGYVSVVDETTGDASFQLAQPSSVGFAAAKAAAVGVERRRGPEADSIRGPGADLDRARPKRRP